MYLLQITRASGFRRSCVAFKNQTRNKWKSKQLTRSQHVHIFVFAGEKSLKFQQLVSLQYFVHVSISPPSVSAALPVLFPQKYVSPSHAASLNHLTIISA